MTSYAETKAELEKIFRQLEAGESQPTGSLQSAAAFVFFQLRLLQARGQPASDWENPPQMEGCMHFYTDLEVQNCKAGTGQSAL
jgi:hypothetical protein